MIELTGSLKQRIDEAIRLAHTDVSDEELEHFRSLYKKAQIPLLPSAEDFYKHYGGVFRNYYIVLTNPEFNKEVYLNFYADSSNFEKEALRRLDDAMMDIDSVRDFAKQEVCPVGDIGYYYPAVVYVGENGLLYCTYEFKDEIEVFRNPSEILESYLKGNVPVGIDEKPVKNSNPKSKRIYQIKTENFFLQFEPIGFDKPHLKNKEKLRVKIKSHGFSADVVLNIGTSELKDFAADLNTFYETLKGGAELEEIRGRNRFSFSSTVCGHVCVFITIIQKWDGHGHELSFGNSFDQTFLKDFSKALFADYGA